jgi:hypothetical protein
MQHVAPADAARCNNAGRVKPAEAARKLKINRSSLSRYLQQYDTLLDDAGLVDLEELRQHRADNPRIADQSAAQGDAGDAPKSKSAATASRKGAKGRVDEIRAWEAERDWAQSIGQLIDPSKLQDEALDAVTALRDKLMAPEQTLCERLAEERDPLVVKQLLRETNRALIDDLKTDFAKIFGGGGDQPEAGDASGSDE